MARTKCYNIVALTTSAINRPHANGKIVYVKNTVQVIVKPTPILFLVETNDKSAASKALLPTSWRMGIVH